MWTYCVSSCWLFIISSLAIPLVELQVSSHYNTISIVSTLHQHIWLPLRVISLDAHFLAVPGTAVVAKFRTVVMVIVRIC